MSVHRLRDAAPARCVTFPIMGDHVSTFAAHVHEFVQWRRRAGDSQRWERIEVVEVDLSMGGRAYPDWPRTAADRFEKRWSQIIADVDRDWISISGCGVRHGTLVLAVEWFSGGGRREPSERASRISVNLSGDAGVYAWHWGA